MLPWVQRVPSAIDENAEHEGIRRYMYLHVYTGSRHRGRLFQVSEHHLVGCFSGGQWATGTCIAVIGAGRRSVQRWMNLFLLGADYKLSPKLQDLTVPLPNALCSLEAELFTLLTKCTRTHFISLTSNLKSLSLSASCQSTPKCHHGLAAKVQELG